MKNYFFVYILSNERRTTYEIGVTNNIQGKVEFNHSSSNEKLTFGQKAKCYNLLHYESYENIDTAKLRVFNLKRISYKKLDQVIQKFNPEFKVLNEFLSI